MCDGASRGAGRTLKHTTGRSLTRTGFSISAVPLLFFFSPPNEKYYPISQKTRHESAHGQDSESSARRAKAGRQNRTNARRSHHLSERRENHSREAIVPRHRSPTRTFALERIDAAYFSDR